MDRFVVNELMKSTLNGINPLFPCLVINNWQKIGLRLYAADDNNNKKEKEFIHSLLFVVNQEKKKKPRLKWMWNVRIGKSFERKTVWINVAVLIHNSLLYRTKIIIENGFKLIHSHHYSLFCNSFWTVVKNVIYQIISLKEKQRKNNVGP